MRAGPGRVGSETRFGSPIQQLVAAQSALPGSAAFPAPARPLDHRHGDDQRADSDGGVGQVLGASEDAGQTPSRK